MDGKITQINRSQQAKSQTENLQKESFVLAKMQQDNFEIPNPLAKPPKNLNQVVQDIPILKMKKPFKISKDQIQKARDLNTPGSNNSSNRAGDNYLQEKKQEQPVFNTPIHKKIDSVDEMFKKPKLMIPKADPKASSAKISPMTVPPSSQLRESADLRQLTKMKPAIQVNKMKKVRIKSFQVFYIQNPLLKVGGDAIKFQKPNNASKDQDDDDQDNYSDEDFEDDNGQINVAAINKLTKKENIKAQNYHADLHNILKTPGNKASAPFIMGQGKIQMGRGIKVNFQKKTAGLATISAQQQRTKDLKEIVDIMKSDYEDIFCLFPSSAHQRQSTKLQGGEIKHALVQTGDNQNQETQTQSLQALSLESFLDQIIFSQVKSVSRGQACSIIQTVQEIECNSNQCIGEMGLNFSRCSSLVGVRLFHKLTEFSFLERAQPLLMTILDENQISQKAKEEESSSKSFSLKSTLKFPQSILSFLKIDNNPHFHINPILVQILSIGQGDITISYEVAKDIQQKDLPNALFVFPLYITIVYSSHSSNPKRALFTPSKPTCLASPQEHLLSIGTQIGSIHLFDLLDSSSLTNFVPYVQINNDEASDERFLKDDNQPKKILFKIAGFTTDNLSEYQQDDDLGGLKDSRINHCASVVDIKTNSTAAGSQIVSLDAEGKIILWSVIECGGVRDDGGSLKDLTLFPGSRYKIIRIDSLLLNKKFNIDQGFRYDDYDQKIISDVVSFDLSSTDPMYLIFKYNMLFRLAYSTKKDLFFGSRFQQKVMGQDVIRLQTAPIGQNSSITSIDLSKDGFLLVGFDCGTVALYQKGFTCAITSWFYVCESKVIKVKWSEFFYTSSNGGEGKKFEVENRLSEFYTLDEKFKLYIWALGKNINVNFSIFDFSQNRKLLDKQISNSNCSIFLLITSLTLETCVMTRPFIVVLLKSTETLISTSQSKLSLYI